MMLKIKWWSKRHLTSHLGNICRNFKHLNDNLICVNSVKMKVMNSFYGLALLRFFPDKLQSAASVPELARMLERAQNS